MVMHDALDAARSNAGTLSFYAHRRRIEYGVSRDEVLENCGRGYRGGVS
jgi:hypothetical protein